MELEQQQHGAVTVLRPKGPLVGQDADALKSRCLEAHRRSLGRLVLDASAVPFVDSRGLEVLVELSEQMGEGGRSLKLCGANETLREVLELTELAELFEHYEDVNTAVRSFL